MDNNELRELRNDLTNIKVCGFLQKRMLAAFHVYDSNPASTEAFLENVRKGWDNKYPGRKPDELGALPDYNRYMADVIVQILEDINEQAKQMGGHLSASDIELMIAQQLA